MATKGVSTLDRPVRWKWAAIVFLSFIGVCLLLMVALSWIGKPPDEAKVIASFQEHRAAYERLRAMIVADRQVNEVATWGITTDAMPSGHPPGGDFSVTRYNEYLGLLKEIKATGIWRSRTENPLAICVVTWSAGFAGDTRHVETCWLNKEPANQIASLKDFYKRHEHRQSAYRRIEGNWYLWAD
jgi:hypothetical protein